MNLATASLTLVLKFCVPLAPFTACADGSAIWENHHSSYTCHEPIACALRAVHCKDTTGNSCH